MLTKLKVDGKKGMDDGCNSLTVWSDNDDECALTIDFSRKIKK